MFNRYLPCLILVCTSSVNADKPLDVVKSLQSDQAQVVDYSKLELVDSVAQGDLGHPTSVVLSPDGKFLYASGYRPGNHVVFARDAVTGEISHVQTIENELTQGATSLRLSQDGRFATATPFGSRAVLLYERDSETGKLELLAQQAADEVPVRMLFPVETQFSLDGNYIYVLDDSGIFVFKVDHEAEPVSLEFVQSLQDLDLKGPRGMVVHPSDQFLFVACKTSHSLNTLRRDTETGKLTMVDVEWDDEGDVIGLHSAFGVTISQDGQFVYSVSGQHGNGKDNSVGVFRFDPEKESLTVVQELMLHKQSHNGKTIRFNGGNEIVLTPNGNHVFACATASGSVAAFERNSETGELTLKEAISNPKSLGWVSGLVVSPDGRFLYTATEKENCISIFKTNGD